MSFPLNDIDASFTYSHGLLNQVTPSLFEEGQFIIVTSFSLVKFLVSTKV